MAQKWTSVSIPKPLYEKIQKRIKGTGFTSVSDYVTFVMREALICADGERGEKIAERYKALGYGPKDSGAVPAK